MQSVRTLLPIVLLATLGACAHGRRPLSTTDEDLELQRVVLYRNGVGYFERTGDVDENILRLTVRKDQINDLLKSLTVIDRASGKAVSVSMPLDPSTWSTAIAELGPEQGSLADMLDALRGVEVTLVTTTGRVRGRVLMVETIHAPPSPMRQQNSFPYPPPPPDDPHPDHRVTLLRGDELHVARLSTVEQIVMHDGDLALQLHRRLDASAGEGMFQQLELAIRLTGAKRHQVFVSYVVPAPMWKPTYRVVLPDQDQGQDQGRDQALLQAWAVVDNTSGEDWDSVDLALTSGEPIAFRYDLHTPRTVDRPDLTERGVRKRAEVAVGETTYDGAAEATEQEEAPREMAEAEPMDEAVAEDAAAAPATARKAKKRAMGGGARPEPEPAAPPTGPGLDPDALRQSTLASATATRVAGSTRFDVEHPVTIPSGTSTMVAIINAEVEAEQTYLFKPGGAGVGYDANPYRVVRFRNTTPFQLEPGPISIYAGGSFVGEGLSETVASGSSATIPFAVEPRILVSSTSERSGEEMQLVRIVRGVLEVQSFARRRTTWTAKAQPGLTGYTVLIRQPKAGWNFELERAPEGTEELAKAYLIPLRVPEDERQGKTTVVEQTPSKTSLSIWDPRAVDLLENLLASARIDASLRKRLEPIVKLRQEIGKIDTRIEGLQRQRKQLDQRADQTRKNLEAIKKDPAGGALRRRLSQRLEEFTQEADRIGREIVELQNERMEKKIRLEDMLQDFDLRAEPTDGQSSEGGSGKTTTPSSSENNASPG